MVTLCWAAKGGSGTTVVTALLAIESPCPALLVDLADELPAVLGLPEPDRPGVVDWLTSDGPPAQLDDLLVDVGATTALLPRGLGSPGAGEGGWATAIRTARWTALVAWLHDWEQRHAGAAWVDLGTGDPQPDVELVSRRLLVTRACYLSLRRAARSPVRPTGVVLVEEDKRSLGRADIERTLGVPVVARVPLDPDIARAVDAGLLVGRPPFSARRSLRRLAA